MINEIKAELYTGGTTVVRRYTEEEIAYWLCVRTSPDNARGPHYRHIVLCPFCREPRYFDRLIIIHIDEKHPEKNL